MTELGHGSNVRSLLTTATYDAATQEFVINTPSDMAAKVWIGNAASTHNPSLSMRASDRVRE